MNGQAKIDFEKWLMDGNDGVSNFCRTIELTRFHFLALKETCQLALIIEFFDSVGIYIAVQWFDKDWIFAVEKMPFKQNHYRDFGFTSRQQATEKALEKAIILYNEKFKENE